MGLMAIIRDTLVSNELPEGKGSELRADRRGALWVRIADAVSGVLAIVDAGLAFIAGGTITGDGTAKAAAPSQTGSGYLTLVNLDASQAIYYGTTGVTSSTGLPIPAGQSRVVRLADLTTAFVNAPAGVYVGWCVER
jgi:hypothetical protein